MAKPKNRLERLMRWLRLRRLRYERRYPTTQLDRAW